MTNDKILLPGLALAKAVDDKLYRQLSSSLEPGTYPIDLTVKLQGGLKKGEAYRQRIAAAANPWALLRVALSKLNGASIEALVREALDHEKSDQDKEIKAAADEAIARLVAAQERECSGKVTATVNWVLLA